MVSATVGRNPVWGCEEGPTERVAAPLPRVAEYGNLGCEMQPLQGILAMPKVSVCIPTHNTARYLPKAIESVLEQEFGDYELVICDNASTDETPELCGHYEDSRIRYVRFNDLTNQAGNFNRCLDQVRGEFFTLLHADDFFLPGFLADRVRRLSQQPETGFVFGAVKVVDSDGLVTDTKSQWPEDCAFAVGELVESLMFGCIVSPPSVMVRKSCANRAGVFRTDLTWGHDWEWMIRLAQAGAACYVSEPLAAYRVHDASGTAEVLNAAENGDQERRILKDTFARMPSGGARGLRRAAFKALARRHMYFAESALLEERREVTRNNLWYAGLADPAMTLRPTYWALLLGSFGAVSLYYRYRALRNGVASGSQL
jgi:glycosyltransferase involved in cell wall biosynthesis